MGYATEYTLEVLDPNYEARRKFPELHEVGRVACDRFGAYGINIIGEAEDAVKWYDHDKSMKAMSLAFPGVLFKLEGIGEEQGDHWIKHFQDGKSSKMTPTITWPDFYPKDLK